MNAMPPKTTVSAHAAVDDRPVKSFQTGQVVSLSICHFIHDVYSSFLAPLLPLLIKKLSLSLTEAGFLTTVMQLPALLNPYLGTLADRISVRYFIILAPGITAVSMSLIGMAPSYGVLLILLLIAGFSVAIFHVPAPVMVARLSGSKKGRGMSFFMTGGELARSLGPLAAVGAVSLLGLEGFYPVMLVGILASLWLFLRFKDIPIRTDTGQRTSVLGTWREMRHVLRPLSVILFFRGVAGVLTAGFLSDMFGRRRILLISLLGAPASLFLFTATGGWIGLAALILVGFTLLSTTPVMLALVQEHAGSSPSAANGFFFMISFIARSAVVVVVGFVGDQIGLKSTYFVSAFLGLAAVPFVLKLPRE
jgi:FSR family fosmidomycin resistance protein-like MFS transporter